MSEHPHADLSQDPGNRRGGILSRHPTPAGERPMGGVAIAQAAEDAYGVLIREVEPETHSREGLADTPARATRALRELTSGYSEDPAACLTTFDSEGTDELVMDCGIPFWSLCEHHLLPFHGHAHIGYIPGEQLVGLSKLARVLSIFSRRLQVQERLAGQIADCLDEHLRPTGVIVVLEAVHLCKQMRGVRSSGTFITSALRGALKDKPEARAEALALIERNRP